ncbi:hypothetical protein FGB62_468g07 [Gracilaria domingensis]|nr:hypothetical protein FGB62_468g07 [Gracilaria domingensis]
MGVLPPWLLLVFVLGCALAPPASCAPSLSNARTALPVASRVATYDDITTTFNLVYTVTDSCPTSVTFGEFTNDERQFPILPVEDIVEGDSECSGDGPLNFVTELTVNEPGLLEALQLQAFRDAISQNGNAEALINSPVTDDLLVGWHSGTRTCGSISYPTETIYFIIREDSDYKITFRRSDSSNRVTVPPDLRALLVVAPQNQICLLVDKSTNPDQDVTLLTIFSNGTETTSQLTTAGAVALTPVNQPPSDGDDADDGEDEGESDTDGAGDDTDGSDAASGAAPPSADPSPDPSASPSASALPSASPAPSVASVVAPVAPSPSDFGTLVASPSGVASPVPSFSPFTSVVPVVSAVPPGAVGGISAEEGVDATSEEDDGSACFPASAVARSERGDLEMRDIELGDRVETAEGLSAVILFTHRRRVGRFEFVRMVSGDLTAASAVVVGDVLRMADGSEDGTVVRIERVYEEGGAHVAFGARSLHVQSLAMARGAAEPDAGRWQQTEPMDAAGRVRDRRVVDGGIEGDAIPLMMRAMFSMLIVAAVTLQPF